jgi:hypothetical protein
LLVQGQPRSKKCKKQNKTKSTRVVSSDRTLACTKPWVQSPVPHARRTSVSLKVSVQGCPGLVCSLVSSFAGFPQPLPFFFIDLFPLAFDESFLGARTFTPAVFASTLWRQVAFLSSQFILVYSLAWPQIGLEQCSLVLCLSLSLLCSPNWPQIQNPPASVLQVLGLQLCATIPISHVFLCCDFGNHIGSCL